MRSPSPLRYPGGKASICDFLAATLELNSMKGAVYVEPFAGGCGAAFKLLFSELVSEIHINDIDPCICSIWRAMLNHKDRFVEKLEKTDVTVAQWRKQKAIIKNPRAHKEFELGFAAFFVNRTNRSGIMNAGPIGGIKQTGDYKIDVRFNKEELQNKIEKIHLYRERIRVWNLDGVRLLKKLSKDGVLSSKKGLAYMDPPYFEKASRLYKHYFDENDHRRLAEYLLSGVDFRWIVSYDDDAQAHILYPGQTNSFLAKYCAHSSKIVSELIIGSSNCKLPKNFFVDTTTTKGIAPLISHTRSGSTNRRTRA